MTFIIGFAVLIVVLFVVYMFGCWIYDDKDTAAGMTLCVSVILFIAYCCVSLLMIMTTPTVM